MKKIVSTFKYTLTIRHKLLLFFGFIIVCVCFISLCSLYINFKFINYSTEHLQGYYTINQLKMLTSESEAVIQRYLKEMNDDHYAALMNNQAAINRTLLLIDPEIDSRDTYLHFRAIKNAMISYQKEVETAIDLRRNDQDYYPTLMKIFQINKYMGKYIDQLLNVSLTEGNWYFGNMVNQSQVLKGVILIGLVFMILIIVTFGYLFSSYLTEPIRRLVLASLQLSIGNLHVHPVEVKSRDEVGILTQSFNKMSASIREHVEDLKQKAVIEHKLHEEEMKNVLMQQLLNDARFMGLQAQINPHFLFNTLNNIARTSMFEGAEKTTKLIQSLSQIFRYNLQAAAKPVSLKRELNIVREYIFIQNYRFGNRISIELSCDDLNVDTEQIIIPSLTIQPIVENGIVHGLEPKEEGGRMRISVHSGVHEIIIKMVDNGVGISPDKLSKLLSNGDNEGTGHTTGIGIANVTGRLKLFYNRDCLTIKSKPNLGTRVIIRIPHRKEEASDE